RDFHVTGVQTCALPISPPDDEDRHWTASKPAVINSSNTISIAGRKACHNLRVMPHLLFARASDPEASSMAEDSRARFSIAMPAGSLVRRFIFFLLLPSVFHF